MKINTVKLKIFKELTFKAIDYGKLIMKKVYKIQLIKKLIKRKRLD